jgi:molecular chaperone DnaJ
MRLPEDDLYSRLGVPPTVGVSELRRAYRLLALRFHPDRAGTQSTVPFQRISEAYRILADPAHRATYDRQRQDRFPRSPDRPQQAPVPATASRAGEYLGPGGRIGWRTPRAPSLHRLSGPIDDLLARGAARRGPDGILELLLTRAEADQGGRAAVETPVTVTCPTCSGVAALHRVWCRRCEYDGQVIDEVAILIEIPPAAQDGSPYLFPTDPTGMLPPLRLRLRVV